jgi:hypothetical protein
MRGHEAIMLKTAPIFLSILIFLCAVAPAWAQPADADMESYKIVKLQSLNKVTARTSEFEIEVGKTVKLGPLYIRPQVCKKPPATDRQDAITFLQVWEDPPTEDPKWIFSGWMFASSPGLSSMDHPVYDIWIVDCSQTQQMAEPEASDEEMKPTVSDDADKDEPVVRLNEPRVDDNKFRDYESKSEPIVRID